MKIEIDEDIRVAKTIPSKFYHSQKVFSRLKDLFNKSWQFVGNTDLLESNNVCPDILLEGMLNEPYILTKKGNEIQCLSNVCTHRGNLVCGEACKTNNLVCGYHGRQFEIDGTMKFMPEFENVKDFPDDGDNLPEIEMETWKNMIFIINDKRCDLSELTSPMVEVGKRKTKGVILVATARQKSFDVHVQ